MFFNIYNIYTVIDSWPKFAIIHDKKQIMIITSAIIAYFLEGKLGYVQKGLILKMSSLAKIVSKLMVRLSIFRIHSVYTVHLVAVADITVT